jgi:geranylgeranyl pyrophosphate synthase
MREALTTFGFQLGMAFHLGREIHETQREVEDVVKHPLWYAISSRLYPLPVRLVAGTADGFRLRALLRRDPLDAGQLREVQRMVVAQQTSETVRRLALEHLRRAQAALQEIPPDPARDELAHLALWVEAALAPSSTPPGSPKKMGGPLRTPRHSADQETEALCLSSKPVT